MTNPNESTGWRDIATAPKDGTPVLAWMFNRPVIAWWNTQKYHSAPCPYWESAGSTGVYRDRCNQPTHWQPLPEGPNGAAHGPTARRDHDGDRGAWEHLAALAELRATVERMKDEAELRSAYAKEDPFPLLAAWHQGAASALRKVLVEVDRIATEGPRGAIIQGEAQPTATKL